MTAEFRRLGFLRLSWPLILVSVLTLLTSIADSLIRSVASADLNAAVLAANQILGPPADLTVLFSIGALVVISQLLGAGDTARARRAAVVALRATTILGAGIAVGVAVLAPVLVRVVNTPDDISGQTLGYLWTAAVSLAFNAFIVTATAVLRAYGNTVVILLLGVLTNGVYLAVQFTLVLVLELGALGAALSTLLVRGLGVVAIGWIVWRRTGARILSRPDPDPTGRTGTRAMAKLSVPTVLENALFNTGVLLTLAIVNTLGTGAVSARAHTLTLTAFVTGFALATAQGNETIVGWDKGEGRTAQARWQTVRAAGWAAAGAAVLALVLWLFSGPIVSIFTATDRVLADTRTLLLLSVLLLPLAAAGVVVFGALRSAGDVVVPVVYSLGATFLVMLPLTWLFVEKLGLGLSGAWYALIVAEAVKAALLLARWWRGRWATIPSVAEPASVGQQR